MSENSNDRRIPPPAFPPGMRRHAYRNSQGAHSDEAPTSSEAYISPDDPLPPRADPIRSAFISPDDPFPERTLDLAEGAHALTPMESGEEGQVVGMDLSPHLDQVEAAPRGDPHVTEVVEAVSKLAEALRRRGEPGLRSTPAMSRFEATLRAYCVGYIAGRRAEEPAAPEVDEALPTDG